jgi:hypothetical protein
MKTLLAFLFFAAAYTANAQKDTLIIKPDDVNTKVLIPGMHRWLIYFKNGVDSPRYGYQMWNRKIDFINYEGKNSIAVTQQWESNDTVTHKVYSVSDAKTFQPYYQDSWWKGRGNATFDLLKQTGNIASHELNDADTARTYKRIWDAFKSAMQQYVLNWHLDLETFPLLPYKEGRTFGINFYELGSSPAQLQYYTVTGSGKLEGFDSQPIDCWLLVHEAKNNKETFFVSKKTKEVLKLEQEFNGRFRIKVKQSFAN